MFDSRKLINPASVYTFVWAFTLGLYSLYYTENLESLRFYTVFLITFNILSSFACYFVIEKIYSAKNVDSISYESKFNKIFRTLVVPIFFVWGLGTVGEIIYENGFPLLWTLTGQSRDYTDFGIPSVHGFLNSCYLIFLTAFFARFLLLKEKKYLFLTILFLSWPILVLGRALMLAIFFQLLSVILVHYRLKLKQVGGVMLILLLLVLAFGVIGDFRGVYKNPFEYLVRENYKNSFDRLPSGFLWTYVYVTSPLSNLNHNIDIEPSFSGNYTIYNLIPSVLRNSDDDTVQLKGDKFTLVDTNLNVSTIYASIFSDFGFVGSFFIVFLLQIISTFYYSKAIRGHLWAILAYAPLFQCLIFSIFFNLFFLNTFIFQVVIVSAFGTGFLRLKYPR